MYRECSRKYALSVRGSSVWIFHECSPNVTRILEPNILLRIFRENSANIRITFGYFQIFPAESSQYISWIFLDKIFGFSIRGTFSEHSGNIQTDELLTLSEYLREHSRNIPWISSCYLGFTVQQNVGEFCATTRYMYFTFLGVKNNRESTSICL